MRITEFLRRAWFLLRRDRATAELEDEMRLHRELRAQSLWRLGTSEPEAAVGARLRFGNPLLIQEESRDMWGLRPLDDLGQDIRYAARRLRQRPGFTLSVVAVLALGIGVTTAMFSAVDAAMLRPLPFPRPQELVTLPEVSIPFDPGPGQQFPKSSFHWVDVNDVAAMPRLFSRVAAWAAGGLNLSDPEHPVRIQAGVVTVGFFTTLGISAALGRTFSGDEGRPGGPHVALLSYGLWQRQFGGREIVNHAIRLNDKSYLVIGVMPRGFSFPKESEVWIPMTVPTTFETFEPFRGYLPSAVIARLAPGIDPDVASQQLFAEWQRGFAATLKEHPSGQADDLINEIRQEGAAVPLQQSLVGDRRTSLIVLMGATGLLLLIACANVTNLLLSQAISRRREIAVREVLGASRGRIVRQLLTESTLLALSGAAIGIAVAPVSLRLLRTVLPTDLAGLATANLDLRVLGFATLLGLGTGVAFGLWPALGTTTSAPGETIKSGDGHGATSRGASRMRRGLVAGELALTVVLLIGAGLMLRSFGHLMGLDRGMNTEHVGTLELAFPDAEGTRALHLRLINDALARLNAVSGIAATGVVNDLPLAGGGGISMAITVDGAPVAQDHAFHGARRLIASGGYFDAMGIRLLAGRTFTSTDDSLAPQVAVISAGMAKLYWPGVNPLGRTFHMGPNAVTVVGVAADVREQKLDDEPKPQMYFSIYSQPPSNVAIVARGSLPSQALLGAMQAAVRSADPSQAIFHVRTMDEVLSTSVAPRRTNTLLISLFAGLALLLASLGVYAVVAHGVAQRSREFGIRSALGATGSDLVSLVSREMAWVTAIGLAAGLAGAWVLARVADSLVYRVAPHDLLTFTVVPLLLFVVAGLATVLPARRALRVNPADVMRAD